MLSLERILWVRSHRAAQLRRWLGLSAFLMLFLPSAAMAGPWSRAPGHFYLKLSQGMLWSSDTNDAARPGRPYFGAATALYGEVGIAYGLQFMAYLPFLHATHFSRTNPNEAYTLGNLGDASFGLQWTPPPLQKLLGFPIALKVDFKVPLYDVQMVADNPPTRDLWSKFPFLGDSQLDITIWLSAGGSIGNTGLYMFGEVGYRIRTSVWSGVGFSKAGVDFADSIVFQYQAGYNILQRVLVMFNFGGVLPTDLGKDQSVTKGFLTVGLGLYVPIWKGLAVEASFDPVVLSFRSDRAISVNFGLSYQY